MEAHAAEKQQVLEWERRWGKPVAYAAIASVLFYVAGVLVIALGDLVNRDNTATELASFHEHRTGLLVVAVLTAISLLLLIGPLYFMFRAMLARNPSVRGVLVGFVFIGPALLAARTILGWAANDSVAKDFVDGLGTRTGQPAIDFADKLLEDSSLVQAAAGIAIPAVLGMIIVMMYVSLLSMRTGLLSRFWGTFGMAFGIGILILGPVGVTIWALYIGLLAARWVNPPPAWDAVEMIPWPVGGMKPDAGPEPGDAVEADGREIDVGEPGADPGEPGEAPRKRKRRG